jgi:hypothetical protein
VLQSYGNPHAGRRNTASCGKVGDKWWIISGKMVLLGVTVIVFSRDELLSLLAFLVYFRLCIDGT